MDVVERNFFRLLRSGTFGDKEQVEPMSEWKWQRVYQLSLMHGVAALVWDGVVKHHDDFFMQLSNKQADEWQHKVNEVEETSKTMDICVSTLFSTLNHQQLRPILMKGQSICTLYPIPTHRTCGDIDIFFPYTPQAKKADQWANDNGNDIDNNERGKLRYTWHKMPIDHHRIPLHLTNPLLNHKLQNIVAQEIRGCDSSYVIINGLRIETLPPTLNLLLIITRIARYIINEGISLKQIVDLGVFLRSMGDKVDYLKLQGWIKQLGLQRMARLESAILIHLLHFDEDEMQFVDGKPTEDTSQIESDILQLTTSHSEDWYFTQGKNIFVRTSNSSAMLWHLRHSVRYSRYYPKESLTSFLASLAHSLSHIEE